MSRFQLFSLIWRWLNLSNYVAVGRNVKVNVLCAMIQGLKTRNTAM